MKLSNWIKQSGISARELAQRIGVTEATISRLKTGRALPSLDLARRLAEATKGAVTANDFIGPDLQPSAPADDALPLDGARVLLIIGGGIAAYKSLDLIRRLKERGARARVVLTQAGAEFVTPLSVGALAGEAPFTDLFDPRSEFDVGHIRLARDTDLVVVAPATADLMARMAAGQAGDLASAVLLATGAPVLLAPAMNPAMWSHPATRRNVARLEADGIAFVGPEEGEMAEAGERGLGRMAEVPRILAAIAERLRPAERPLAGLRVLVTSGPTHEPLDPVRYIANRSSGRQGAAIAEAAARAGADTVLVTGPTAQPDLPGVHVVPVETAQEMLAAAEAALPVDVAVCAAAVADWRAGEAAAHKIKKRAGDDRVTLALVQNPDILATLSRPGPRRPRLVIGFAAETENVVANAAAKRRAKGCDWIVANDVSAASGVMGGARNRVHLITADGREDWPEMAKEEVAERLVARVAAELAERVSSPAKAGDPVTMADET